jgi:ketosteroid isomerase-like protein
MQLDLVRIAAIALLAGTMLLPSDPLLAQSTDPISVLQQYYAARSRGDLAGAMSLVAPDATYTTGPCAPVCVGAADIQAREVGPAMANGGQYTAVNVSASGENVTLQIEVRNRITQQIGIDRFLNDVSAEVRDGKIVAYTAASVPSDPQTATYLAYAKSQASGQTPSPVPAAELSVSPAVLVVLGIALVAVIGLTVSTVMRLRPTNQIR